MSVYPRAHSDIAYLDGVIGECTSPCNPYFCFRLHWRLCQLSRDGSKELQVYSSIWSSYSPGKNNSFFFSTSPWCIWMLIRLDAHTWSDLCGQGDVMIWLDKTELLSYPLNQKWSLLLASHENSELDWEITLRISEWLNPAYAQQEIFTKTES